jgi:hypothetical protein
VKFYGGFIVSKSLSNRIVVTKPHFNVEVYSHNICSDSLFIEEYKVDSENRLTNKFDLSGKLLVFGSGKEKGKIYICDLANIGNKAIRKSFDTGVDKMVRDLSIGVGCLYILYEGSSICRINVEDLPL